MLTPRQQQIVSLMVEEDLSDAQIAARLGLSTAAIRCHIFAACARLNVRSRLQLGAWYGRNRDSLPPLPPVPGRGSARPQARLTEAQVSVIRARIAAGENNLTALGEAFGVSRHAIRDIRLGKRWGHVE